MKNGKFTLRKHALVTSREFFPRMLFTEKTAIIAEKTPLWIILNGDIFALRKIISFLLLIKPHVCCPLFVAGGLCTSLIRIAM